MIDYQKLKLAHEICGNTDDYYFDISFGDEEIGIYLYKANDYKAELINDFNNLDDLITKLQELTQPKPKYKIGHEVYHAGRDEVPILTMKIDEIGFKTYSNSYIYYGDEGEVQKCYLYPSREALIQAQI